MKPSTVKFNWMSTSKRVRALCDFLGCSYLDIECLNPYGKHMSIFRWGKLYYEILTKSEVHEGTTPASHYVHHPFLKTDYRIRELGAQSQLIKDKLHRP